MKRTFKKIKRRLTNFRSGELWHWARHTSFSFATGIPLLRYCKIDEYVFIGGFYGKLGRKVLVKAGIRNSINLQEKNINDKQRLMLSTGYLHLPTEDDGSISDLDIAEGISFIEKCRENQEGVYIHCKSGIGRAPTLGIAFLLSKGMSFDSALKRVKSVRPFIMISEAQRKQLLKYAPTHLSESQKGQDSCKTEIRR
ncbi:MAG: dual specificity protein phosphatase family protein [Chloracidobacterium sp.]|nr:dual specificity protein phosphatase family protein [Chloracidobacterium sp.]